MSIAVRGRTDSIIDQLVDALKKYDSDHDQAQIDIYRQNPLSVRIRVIDPNFADLDRVERSELIWNRYLIDIDEETQADIGSLILITPDEMPRSMANFEFENPEPSLLQSSTAQEANDLPD